MDARELMKELADRIESTANVRAVFGEPVGEGPNIIIPVARVTVRGGGGGGSDPTAGDELTGRRGKGSGMGLGLNITTAPVGYIKRTADGPVFVPTVDLNRAVTGGLVVAGFALWVIKTSIRMARRRQDDE